MYKFILMLFCMLPAIAAANDMCGFKGVSFGSDKEKVLEQIENKDYLHESDYGFFVYLYPVGDKSARLNVFIDDNNKFYGFYFNFDQYTANRIENEVQEDLFFITKIFTDKYKKPSKVYNLTTLKIISKETIFHFKEWKNKSCTANTGISHDDNLFNAYANVFDNKLLKAQHNRDLQKQKATNKKAVESF